MPRRSSLSRRYGAILIAAMVVLISPLTRPAHASDISRLLESLPRYLARSRPTWQKDPEGEGNGATLLGNRQPWGVSFTGVGVRPFPSDSAFGHLSDSPKPTASG